MIDAAYVQRMARYNRWQNESLYGVADTLSDAERKRAGLTAQFGAALSFLEPGMLIGTPQEVIDRIGAYVSAGAEWIILALRAPFDMEGLQVFIDDVMPAFR